MRIVKQDLFATPADAILLTIDGHGPGMGGNLARQFEAQYEDAWEEISQDFRYPIPLGTCEQHAIPDDIEASHRSVIIASTLNHLETLSDEAKSTVISNALRHGLALVERAGLCSLCTAVMAGGWRLSQECALESMQATYNRYHENSIRPVDLIVALPDTKN